MNFRNIDRLSQRHTAHRSPSQLTGQRTGITLTELLVVVSIVVLLSSALIPLLQPVMRGQRVREASRQLNVFLAGAQARATASGRPVGVWIERAGHEPTDPFNSWYTAQDLYLAEQPAPYTGDLLESRVLVQPSDPREREWRALYNWDPTRPDLALNCCGSLFPTWQQSLQAEDARLAIAMPGDMIRFNGRGPSYVIQEITPNWITFLVPSNLRPMVRKLVHPPPNAAGPDDPSLAGFQSGVPFEIFRRPVKASGTPLELPRNTGIDLSLSGYGTPFNSPYAALNGYNTFIPPASPYAARFREINPEYDIVIMFKPEGGVDRIYYVSHEMELPSFWEVPQGMIGLMLARDDQIGRNIQGVLNIDGNHVQNIVRPLGEANLRDADNLWLSISTQSGRLQTAPNQNGFTNPVTGELLVGQLPLNDSIDARAFIQNARAFAQTGQSMGGQ